MPEECQKNKEVFMKKIAIIGCESSHAKHFLSYIGEHAEFSDIHVVGVYSDNIESARALANEFDVKIMSGYDEAVGNIDGLIITARDGSTHYKYALPYIKSNVPMLIDKPFTQSEGDAVALINTLKKSDIRVMGGSALKYDTLVRRLKSEAEACDRVLGGMVRAPLMSGSEYGGFFFYAQHLVEMICEIFGAFPKSVFARTVDKQTTVIFHYATFDCTGIYVEGNHKYYASVMTEKATFGEEIFPDEKNDLLLKQFSEFNELLHGGEQHTPYERLIAPVFIMNAIKRAIDSGTEQIINYCE
jgi:predicted dehydrogenase